MATASAPQVQTSGLLSYADYGCSHWLGCTASPKEEARSLFAMIGRNGDTIESIRELIAVPPVIEQALRLYVRQHPEDAEGIERVLQFRRKVSEEFEKLIAVWTQDGPHNQIESNTAIETTDAIESPSHEASSAGNVLRNL